MKKKIYHKISNAYDAYWFIHDHPKFLLADRNEITPEEATKMEAKGYWITRDVGGRCYRMYRHLYRHAIDSNLDIYYTKTDKPGGHGRVKDDKSKNKHVECWLEFGQEEYGYMYSGGSEPNGDYDTETMRLNYHDTDLDTGASTFDKALVNLAKLVRKHHGDYKPYDGRAGKCGTPTCADCEQVGVIMEKMGLD